MKCSIALAIGGLLSCASALAQTAPTITISAEEVPESQPWTQPAGLSYVQSSDNSKNRLAVDFAGKLQGAFSDDDPTQWFFQAGVHVNDQDGKDQQSFSFKAGLHFEPEFASDPSNYQDIANSPRLFVDLSLGANSLAVFPNDEAPSCIANPSLEACDKQYQQSLRAELAVQPYLIWFDQRAPRQLDGEAQNSTMWDYSFAPVLTVFHDQILDGAAKLSGEEIEGGATGGKLVLAGSLAPPILGHRLVFRASYSHIWILDRSSDRKALLPANSHLWTASVDYEFATAKTSDGSGWTPSLGAKYTDGADPLTGRSDREDLTIGLRLKYSAPKS